MSAPTPPSPKTPLRKVVKWKLDSSIEGPGCCSTPSTSGKKNGPSPSRKILWEKKSPSKHTKLFGSPIKQSSDCQKSNLHQSFPPAARESESEASSNFSHHASSTDPSLSKTFSSSGTVTVELDFPHGGWDAESSDDNSSCSLEIVESEAESNFSPVNRGKKRKTSEVSVEDNAILSGMGEEIERQLEAKAERNRLTVPNVKNILRSVITNPYVQAMVRRSIKSGDVAVSGDSDDMSFEPRITRAKAKLLCDTHESNLSEVAWVNSPLKPPAPSDCRTTINELSDDSVDDEDYHPGEEEPSDNDYSERDGSERDMSLEQSPAFCDTDNESFSAAPSPSPKPPITNSSTQTNWSEDGVFKVPVVPPELAVDHTTEENIALRTRSKLPLNDTPLEVIEQATILPDEDPDLYDPPCDNADWQEFLKEFMQPMRSEPEVQNHDDDDEDPEYNVLAEEEIIDKEELRMDRAVKVSKRELNELMRELLEFTENFSSDDEDKDGDNTWRAQGSQEATASLGLHAASSSTVSPGLTSSTNAMGSNEDMSFFLDEYMSLGTLTPLNQVKATPPPSRSPNTPTLHTPVPPMSPPMPCRRTPGAGKKGSVSDVNSNTNCESATNGIGKPLCHSAGKMKSGPRTPGKSESYVNSNCSINESEKERNTVGKLNSYPGGEKRQNINGKLGSYLSSSAGTQVDINTIAQQHEGKLDSYPSSNSVNQCDSSLGPLYRASCELDTMGLIGTNVVVPVSSSEGTSHSFSFPGKDYFLLTSRDEWEKQDGTLANLSHRVVLEFQNTDNGNWDSSNVQTEICESSSAPADVVEQPESCRPCAPQEDDDPEMSVSLALSSSPASPVDSRPEVLEFSDTLTLSQNGDVLIGDTVLLSVAQRLVFDQQLRQYVQLLTQHYLQTFQHPSLSKYAEISKRQLVSLSSYAGNTKNSALRAANLQPALELVKSWEEKFSSEEGTEILRFYNQELSESKRQRCRRTKYVQKFCPQIMNAFADSTAIVYPELLPHMPFRSLEFQLPLMLPSENHLLAVGLEEFVDFIKGNELKLKNISYVGRAIPYVSEYLLVGRCPDKLYKHFRSRRRTCKILGYYYDNKRAPETKHIVKAFNKLKMTTIKERPLHALPPVWRDFIVETINTAEASNQGT